MTSTNLFSGQQTTHIEATLDHSGHSATVRIDDVLCKQKTSGAVPICRVLLSTGDNALVMVNHGLAKWTREEALADIVAVEMIDLQLSDEEGSIESELKNKDGKQSSNFCVMV